MTRRPGSTEPRKQGPSSDVCNLCAFEPVTDVGAFTCHELACPFLPEDADLAEHPPPDPSGSGDTRSGG